MSSFDLSFPSLGHNVQLGMLYDARTNQFFSGASLWKKSSIDFQEESSKTNQVQNADFKLSKSREERFYNAGLNVEGSLSLDLGIIEAAGSAKYLSEKQTSAFEARIDMSCTVTCRTLRIPQETLAAVDFPDYLQDNRYTHFVSEITEGGTATLSFVHKCSSEVQKQRVMGELQAKIDMIIPSRGLAQVDCDTSEKTSFVSTRISYSGSFAEKVSTFEDAARVVSEMPSKLANQSNTLTYKLLPLSILDSRANRLINELDSMLLQQTAAALAEGKRTELCLESLPVYEENKPNYFPIIQQQITNFLNAFATASTQFKISARKSLQNIRSANDVDPAVLELQNVVSLYERRIRVAKEFYNKKIKEREALYGSIAILLEDGFENDLQGSRGWTLAKRDCENRLDLVLSFGGDSLNKPVHPLQIEVDSTSLSVPNDSEEEDDDEDSDDGLEWFEDSQIEANVRSNCKDLVALQDHLRSSNCKADLHFKVASIDKAFKIGGKKKSKTSLGDIVLVTSSGMPFVVTGLLPKAPEAPTLTLHDQCIICVDWNPTLAVVHGSEEIISTKGYVISYRPVMNPMRDSAYARVVVPEVETKSLFVPADDASGATVFSSATAAATSSDLSCHFDLENLYDDCDYEVKICCETSIGPSPFSKCAVIRTMKPPTVASELNEFFLTHRACLEATTTEKEPWASDHDSRSLYLGHQILSDHRISEGCFAGQLAVRVVNVASDFRPHIGYHSLTDTENTKVIVFTGTSGHGKSTQINAFISALLNGDFNDAYRIMVIDDRKANQVQSVTQFITCYCIRPFNPNFEGKTIIIVDTPGYGDTNGLRRDYFVTAAMSEFFKMMSHVNAIVFTCKADEQRTTILSPVSTFIFSLFAKEVSQCLRTVYTFSCVGRPSARSALLELGWPIENGEVAVNNAGFRTIPYDDSVSQDNIRDWYKMSVNGQIRISRMLLKMPPVPTEKSAQVTTVRLQLEQKCELAEKKILKTSNDAQMLTAKLGALAGAVGKAPKEKVKMPFLRPVHEDIARGKYTTLCTHCQETCHDICDIGDSSDKHKCIAMNNGHCTVCKGKCHWSLHHNAKFIIRSVPDVMEVVCEELLMEWNTNNKTIEGSLLSAIDSYVALQEELRNDILYLVELTDRLKNTALRHEPAALLNYVETLIINAKTKGAPPEQLLHLITAKNVLKVAGEVNKSGKAATTQSSILLKILKKVKYEMKYRTDLPHNERLALEEQPCDLYNSLYDALPAELQEKAPQKLQSGFFTGAVLYPANLKAVVGLVQVVLSNGGVVAALVPPNDST